MYSILPNAGILIIKGGKCMLKHVTEATFQKEVLENNKVTLVDFYADWCGPCKMVSPILEKIASETENFDIAKINVDENQTLAMQYRIMSIPNMLVFKNGEVVDEVVGFLPEQSIKDLLAKHL